MLNTSIKISKKKIMIILDLVQEYGPKGPEAQKVDMRSKGVKLVFKVGKSQYTR